MKMITTSNVPIMAWTDGVLFDEEAQKQLKNLATLPFVYKHLAVMPDVHVGKGSTIGTVMATRKAIIPAAVGVDLGCGMMAVRTNLVAKDLPDSLGLLRNKIEEAIPVGSSPRQKIGQWNLIPHYVMQQWNHSLAVPFDRLCEKYPRFIKTNNVNHLGTLGGGNHFIEICLDEYQDVWFMLHSGSRGIGNAIGTHFIELAKQDMQRHTIHLPDKDLAYFSEGSTYFNDYCQAVEWAQNFAAENRRIMMRLLIDTVSKQLERDIICHEYSVNCHHNYVQREQHFGREVWVTRKGAVSAQKGQMGIIPGSMGAKSFIVRGLGTPESFHSCSHGAGRVMSRTKAKQLVNLDEHRRALARVECKKDASTLDETPQAYKDIDAVMAAQSDLVEIVYTLKQVLCVKG
ncbi:RtcB family protein [Legionella lytica]|uniref:3'-phosphate/5'-hydroxy nucleic acid ligase n=1 Tax=Legionella lytica TaxID=96232 RepID=A0ABW8D3K8_9GAMM